MTDNLVLHPGGKKRIVRVGALIFEWQDGDRVRHRNRRRIRLFEGYAAPVACDGHKAESTLANLQHKYGGASLDRRVIRQDHRHGFSILKTNRETGARTCEVYLASSERPRTVDDEATLTLGHEVLHCMLGDYH